VTKNVKLWMVWTAVLPPCLGGLCGYTCTQSNPLAVFPKWHKYYSRTGEEKILSWVQSSRCLGIYNRTTTTVTSERHSNHWHCFRRLREWQIVAPSLTKGLKSASQSFQCMGTLEWKDEVWGQNYHPDHLIYTSQSIQLCLLLSCCEIMQLIKSLVTGWSACSLKENMS